MQISKSYIPALTIPLLFLAFSGDWVWEGDGRIIMNRQSAFSGSVEFAGITLKNSIASISLVTAFLLVVVGFFRGNKDLGILGLGALVIPSLHSAYYLFEYYNEELRNGLSHLAFIGVILLVGWMAYLLIFPPEDEEPYLGPETPFQ